MIPTFLARVYQGCLSDLNTEDHIVKKKQDVALHIVQMFTIVLRNHRSPPRMILLHAQS